MAAKVIVVANRKGGTGKSTISRDVSSYLAIVGYNVLLIDTDSQGTLAKAFNMRPSGDLYDLIVRREPWPNVAHPIPPERYTTPDHPAQGNLFIVRSDHQTTAIPVTGTPLKRLLKRIDEVRDRFDYILIDTAPTVTMLDNAIYAAADSYLFVTLCDTWSIDGVREGVGEIREARDGAIRILGIIPNAFQANIADQAESFESLVEMYGDSVWEPIPKRVSFSEAARYTVSIFAYRPGSEEAEKIAQIAERFIAEVARV